MVYLSRISKFFFGKMKEINSLYFVSLEYHFVREVFNIKNNHKMSDIGNTISPITNLSLALYIARFIGY